MSEITGRESLPVVSHKFGPCPKPPKVPGPPAASVASLEHLPVVTVEAAKRAA